MEKNWFPKDYKIFRDAVHGDIIVENKYLAVIGAKEFQRLRRIRQLAAASLVFPSADHTRFSHSVGTFYVMKKIIAQIAEQFAHLKRTIDERDKNIALLSALLHDIGHGPFSHAFENIFSENPKTHEEWTIEIIKSKATAVNKILCAEFDDAMPADVASLIEKSTIRKTNDVNAIFYNILSSLISSQIDADRLDYLLRDSYHTGVIFGNIDLNRIINAINITVYNGRPVVYIQEKYLPDIEEYLFSRYQMNKSVYYHPTKVEIEEIIRLIFKRAGELLDNGTLERIPDYLQKMQRGELSVSEYCELDEPLLIGDFRNWMQSSDSVLRLLCAAYLNREKFSKIKILDGKRSSIDDFKKNLCAVLNKYAAGITDLDSAYFWIERNFSFTMYKSNTENILVLNKMGKMQDITEISSVFTPTKDNAVNRYDGTFTYLSFPILKEYAHTRQKKMLEDVTTLVNSFDTRNHIEIENKYLLGGESLERVEAYLAHEYGKAFAHSEACTHTDTYFDTLARDFFMAGETIRIRERDGTSVFTIKTPVSKDSKDLVENKNERFEYEKRIDRPDITLCYDYINEKSRFGRDITFEMVAPLLIIKNRRKKCRLNYQSAEFEIVFDNFSYFEDGAETPYYAEKQIEIELKSDYSKKIALEAFSAALEKTFPLLQKTTDSKLKIGIQKLEGER